MNKKAFSLIELLVVVLIIGILTAAALPQYTATVEKARSTEGVGILGGLRYGAEGYRLTHGYFPASLDEPGMNRPTAKYFTVDGYSADPDDRSAPFIITVTRQDGPEDYVLSAVVRPGGTFARYCSDNPATASGAPAASSDSGVTKLCDMITAGNSLNGNW